MLVRFISSMPTAMLMSSNELLMPLRYIVIGEVLRKNEIIFCKSRTHLWQEEK